MRQISTFNSTDGHYVHLHKGTGWKGLSSLLIVMSILMTAIVARCSNMPSPVRVNTPPNALIAFVQLDRYSKPDGKVRWMQYPGGVVRTTRRVGMGRFDLGKKIHSIALSPDRRKVLVTASSILPSGKERNILLNGTGYDLWLIDVKSRMATPLTTDGYGYALGKWSPDGRFVAAISFGGVPAPREDEAPALPNDTLSARSDLAIWDLRSRKRHIIPADVNDLAWSPDSRRLVVSLNDGSGFYAVDLRRRMLRPFLKPIGKGSLLGSFSPSGGKFAYSTNLDTKGRYSLVIESLKSRQRWLVSGFAHSLFGLVWSHNDRFVAFAQYSVQAGGRQRRTLYVYDLVTKRTRHLWTGEEAIATAWSSDGKWVIVTQNATNKTLELMAVSVETGRGVRLLPTDMTIAAADWSER